MEVAVYNIKGEDTGRKVVLNDAVFAVEASSEANPAHVVYLDVKQYLANQRQGTHKSKERSEVSGSTRKLGRQKGGGGARRGDINSPVLIGGGRVFGPKPRDYRFKLNKKVKQLARRLALTSKAQEGAIKVVENIAWDAPKTKNFVALTKALNLDGKNVLLVLNEANENIVRSVRNVPGSYTMLASNLNAYTVLNNQAIVLTEASVETVNAL
ncbi:MAG: 50S ribosomal protein L4 [Muribaculaceae bacterium]|nr:50S ribosomal protein L4 [Muribaculaceae bacterium]